MRIKPRILLLGTLAIFIASVLCFTPQLLFTACISRANRAIENRKWQSSERWLQICDKIREVDSQKAFLKARLARKRGRIDQMAEQLRLAINEGYPQSLVQREFWLAEAQVGRLTSLEKHLPKLLAAADDSADEICEAYACGCMLNYRFNEAITILELWQKDFPDNPHPSVLLGRIAEYQLDLDTAESHYRTAIRIDSSQPCAWYNLGRLLLTRQKPKEALQCYVECERSLEEPQPALVSQAQCLRLLNRTEEARSKLLTAINHSGQLVEESYRLVGETSEAALSRPCADLAQLELSEKNYERSVELFEQALSGNPNDWKTLFGYGSALQRCGKPAEAQKAFERVKAIKSALAKTDNFFDMLKRDPNNADARAAIGEIFLDNLSEKQGVIWLNSALSIDKNHQLSHRLLANYFEKKSADSPEFDALAREHRSAVISE